MKRWRGNRWFTGANKLLLALLELTMSLENLDNMEINYFKFSRWSYYENQILKNMIFFLHIFLYFLGLETWEMSSNEVKKILKKYEIRSEWRAEKNIIKYFERENFFW